MTSAYSFQRNCLRAVLAVKGSRVAAPNAPLTAARHSEHLSAKKEWCSPEWLPLASRSSMSQVYPLKTRKTE